MIQWKIEFFTFAQLIDDDVIYMEKEPKNSCNEIKLTIKTGYLVEIHTQKKNTVT